MLLHLGWQYAQFMITRPSIVNLLWKTPMYPAAFYRAMSDHLPHKSFLADVGSVADNLCSFCGNGVDTLRHFTVDCPVKWSQYAQWPLMTWCIIQNCSHSLVVGKVPPFSHQIMLLTIYCGTAIQPIEMRTVCLYSWWWKKTFRNALSMKEKEAYSSSYSFVPLEAPCQYISWSPSFSTVISLLVLEAMSIQINTLLAFVVRKRRGRLSIFNF